MDTSESLAAFAKVGPAMNFEVSYKLNRFIEASILFCGQQNEVDSKTISDKLSQAHPDSRFTVSSDDWNIGKIMGGINLFLPIDNYKKINVTGRIMAGLLKTTAPKFILFQANFNNNTGFPSYSQTVLNKASLDWTFAYSVGIGCRYDFFENFFLRGNIDYSASSPESPNAFVKTSATVVTFPNPGDPILVPGTNANLPKQPLNTVNICVGIGMNF